MSEELYLRFLLLVYVLEFHSQWIGPYAYRNTLSSILYCMSSVSLPSSFVQIMRMLLLR